MYVGSIEDSAIVSETRGTVMKHSEYLSINEVIGRGWDRTY